MGGQTPSNFKISYPVFIEAYSVSQLEFIFRISQTECRGTEFKCYDINTSTI